jgi:hypothetical protein
MRVSSKMSVCLSVCCLLSVCLLSVCLLSVCLLSVCLLSVCLLSVCLLYVCLLSVGCPQLFFELQKTTENKYVKILILELRGQHP